jgi:hypothetical protein
MDAAADAVTAGGAANLVVVCHYCHRLELVDGFYDLCESCLGWCPVVSPYLGPPRPGDPTASMRSILSRHAQRYFGWLYINPVAIGQRKHL